ncbi:rCG63214 [Rattus norvegicus]|uniref:RCG63214 n=1 Tax=Rattus norvegicus TaxID=10116 RepID=A6KMY9_RAT|nr:rCG63214 [Rattus norvegicus]
MSSFPFFSRYLVPVGTLR